MSLTGLDEEFKLVRLPLSQIEPDPRNIRRQADRASIETLRLSLQAAVDRGTEYHNSITVYPISRDRYRIKFGHRRFYAAQGVVESLHCRVVDRPPSDSQLVLEQLEESLHQEQLNDLDVGWALRRYQEATGSSLSTLQSKVDELGLSHRGEKPSKSWVRFHLDLTRLTDGVQALIASQQLVPTTAWLLKDLPGKEQLDWAQQAVGEGWTKREVEDRLRGTFSPDMAPGRAAAVAGEVHAGQPEFDQAQLAGPLSGVPGASSGQRRAPDSSKRNSAVRTSHEYPILNEDLSAVASGIRRRLEALRKHPWTAQADARHRAVAGDAIRWGKLTVPEAIALAERFDAEWESADELVQRTMVAVRQMLDYRNGLTGDAALGSLLGIYLLQLGRCLGTWPSSAQRSFRRR